MNSSVVPASIITPLASMAIRSEILNTSGNIVADDHAGEFKSRVHLANQLMNALAKQRVQPGGRLVEQHDFGLGHQRARQAGAFLHAAADFGGKFIAHAVETHLRQAFVDFFFDLRLLELRFVRAAGNATLSKIVIESSSAAP